jgi:serine/threonine protein kinase
LNGLSYVHSKGIAHADIKVENILTLRVSDDKDEIPILKLCDFGLS